MTSVVNEPFSHDNQRHPYHDAVGEKITTEYKETDQAATEMWQHQAIHAHDGVVNSDGLYQTYDRPYKLEPSFALYLWSALPILLFATGNYVIGVIATIATIVNFFIIQIATYPINRYMMTGLVSLVVVVVVLYFATLN